VISAHATLVVQPRNGLPSSTFINDRKDDGLLRILAVLDKVKHAPDIRDALPAACTAASYDMLQMAAS
jgi:TFIIF-interacting CTD phosphatase-like protein